MKLIAAAILVPLPFIVCANVRGVGMVRHSFHAQYETAKETALFINEEGFDVTTGDGVSHFVNDTEVKEVVVWEWTGEFPVCPQPLSRRSNVGGQE